MSDNEERSTIDYRLDNIERTLTKVEKLLVDTQLQQRSIDDLNKEQAELLNAYNCHDQRIRALETAPDKDKASKWKFITDYIFKFLVAGIVALVVSKFGGFQ